MLRIMLVAIAALLVPASSLRAEVPNRSPVELRESAAAIVRGRVVDVGSRREREGDWEYERLSISIEVHAVEKGEGVEPGATIVAEAWRREWRGSGQQPLGTSGHRGLPAVGDLVRAFLEAPVPVDAEATGGDAGATDAPRRFPLLLPNGVATIDAREVTFTGQGGLELAGTLTLPPRGRGDGETRVPAVLLLPGSGPTDRDGNQPPLFMTNLLRDLAGELEGIGVATLRFDKRACPRYATSWPPAPEAMAEYFAYQPFVDDARAALQFLRSQEAIDPARVAIVGHSEGGLYALQVAADVAAAGEPLAGIALLATAGRTLDIVIHEQISRQLAMGVPDPAQRAQMLAALDGAIEAVRADGAAPADLPPWLRGLFNPSTGRLLQSYFSVEPRRLARQVPGRILVLNGAFDAQISPERDAAPLAEAFRTREGADARSVTLVVVPATSHNLKEARSAMSPGMTGPIVPEALAAILAWAREALEP